MTVTLPKKLEAFVQRKVRAGDFRNASEVVREAVRGPPPSAAFGRTGRHGAARPRGEIPEMPLTLQ
ncbi:MAG TPA: ribbon-helix-helix domain-containing protein [Verrucomicrobiae bacterium]